MRQLANWEFDAYAMALPRGHGFGNEPPVASFVSDDGTAWATICRSDDSGAYSYFVMRRRVDQVWTRAREGEGYKTRDDAFDAVIDLDDERPPEPIPRGVARRPPLYQLKGRRPPEVLKLLAKPSHWPAAWMLNQL